VVFGKTGDGLFVLEEAQAGAALATVIGEFPSQSDKATGRHEATGKAGTDAFTRQPGDRPRHLTK
jgi:hypothetical protein